MTVLQATATTASRVLLRRATAVHGRRYLSVQGEEAVGRLKDALEQYRVKNYQQEIPSRFKKEMVSQCQLASSKTDTIENIEELLQNIGVFGKEVTHDDVERIVTELGATDEATNQTNNEASTILSKIL